MNVQLTHYEAACRELRLASTIDEVSEIRVKAEALKLYARQTKAPELMEPATRIVMQALRRSHEIIEDMRQAGMLAKGTRGQLVGPGVIGGVKNTPPEESEWTLASVGIDKNLAKEIRRVGAMAEARFQQELARAVMIAVATIRGEKTVLAAARLQRHAERQAQRATREQNLAKKIIALPEERFGVILADPEWKFETYSEKGLTYGSADNHYPTSPLAAIKARDVAAIAAQDCVLFLWATVPILAAALEVMAAWGFRYVSNFVWIKPNPAQGYWNRNRHEHLLVGVRGAPPAPAQGKELKASVIEAPTREHSVKPVEAYEMIEAYFPHLPKIEMNARAARDGWSRWGLEAPA
jgi:N6-adenosine-specific RNA methylase IME4